MGTFIALLAGRMARSDVVTDHSRPGWRSRDILKAAAIILGFWLVLQFLWIVRNLILIGFLGAILGIVIAAATDRLERWRVPRAVGATGIVILTLGTLVGLGFAMAPTLSRQVGELRSKLPEVLDRVEQYFGVPTGVIGQQILDQLPQQQQQAGGPEGAASKEPGTEKPSPPAQTKGEEQATQQGQRSSIRRLLTSNFSSFLNILFPVATATASLFGALVIILFVALFIAISPDHYREGFLRIIPPSKRDRGREVLREMSSTLKQWALARLIAMVAVGLVVGVSLAAIGVRAAALLGFIAGLLELVPFFGPIASAIPAIGMALLDSPKQAVIVVLLFVVVQQLEGNLLSPLLLEKRVDVPPLLTILTVPALTITFGLLGALIAEPLIAIALLLVRTLWVEDHLESPD